MNSTQPPSAFPFFAQTNPNFAYSTQAKPWRSSMNSTHTQHIQTRDFYLDTFFNPVWMSGKNVFSFNADGTVNSPRTTPSTLEPPRISGKATFTHKTYAATAKSTLSQGWSLSRGEMSPLLNVTKAEPEEVPVREVEDEELIYAWPPNLSAYQREVGERNEADAAECADESVATAVLYGASPTVSGSTGGSSPMVATPTQCDNRVYVHHGSPQESEEGVLEKIMGLKRLRCKAPPPLCLGGINQAHGEIGCILLDRDGERTARETQMLSPLTAAIEITSKLSARVSVAPCVRD
ncbi:hypothetical protein K503DRAFT_859823 [Rhizopogon vinicolor AM-OR11-026]|uniref:Uncharacterized protein n=1 Tax=Rhizopogon vinicolor AM-OR11-026 TaxID=1314800 RepID=A0A1B7MLB4_9AGAM|nr:hypothetical protein K503DRAFT_859823 [Rhizopogon vinicolor AM-OR11-026]